MVGIPLYILLRITQQPAWWVGFNSFVYSEPQFTHTVVSPSSVKIPTDGAK